MESPTYGTPNLWDIFRSCFVQKVSHKLANDCITQLMDFAKQNLLTAL